MFRDSIELPFFRHYLENAGTLALANATMFETGSNRWRRFDQWPPKGVTTRALYLHAGGKLSFEPPARADGAAFDKYVSDPANPVPFLAGHSTGMAPDYMARDQRFAAARPDVLVYASEPLAEDVTIAGSVHPALFVSSSGTDSDWIVKLIDVHPDSTSAGSARLLPRVAFRSSSAATSCAESSGTATLGRSRLCLTTRASVAFGMDDVLHTFQRGHRIMVQVQSSWFPLVDRNPQTFVDIYHAVPSDFRTATEHVYRSTALPSHLDLPVLP